MRLLWRLIETLHAVVLHANEREEAYRNVGLYDLERAYFATRAAPLGTVGSNLATACLFWFSPIVVARHLPAVWTEVTPADVLRARLDVFDKASARVLGEVVHDPTISACGQMLADVVRSSDFHGYPMFAAHAATPRPVSGHLDLFWAATALRELRGDAHIVALQAAGVSPVESHVLMVALGLVPGDQVRRAGWSECDGDDAAFALRERGWLTVAGRVTREGLRQRALIEHGTDRMSAPALAGLGESGMTRAAHALSATVGKFVTAGCVPYPNHVGIAPLAELAVPR